jgi:hypothetical protein
MIDLGRGEDQFIRPFALRPLFSPISDISKSQKVKIRRWNDEVDLGEDLRGFSDKTVFPDTVGKCSGLFIQFFC